MNGNAGRYGTKRAATREWIGGERKRMNSGDSWRRRRSTATKREGARAVYCAGRSRESSRSSSSSSSSSSGICNGSRNGSCSLEISRHHSECKSSSICRTRFSTVIYGVVLKQPSIDRCLGVLCLHCVGFCLLFECLCRPSLKCNL